MLGSRFILSAEPPHAQVFYALLCVATVLTMWRAARLFTFVMQGRIVSLFARAKSAAPTDGSGLADAVLNGGYRVDVPQTRAELAVWSDLGRSLRVADARFEHRWYLAFAYVSATRNLATVTVLLSIIVVAIGAYPTAFWELFERNVSVQEALLRALDHVLARLAIGLSVATTLRVVASIFEVHLLRRRAEWRLLRGTLCDDGCETSG